MLKASEAKDICKEALKSNLQKAIEKVIAINAEDGVKEITLSKEWLSRFPEKEASDTIEGLRSDGYVLSWEKNDECGE